jgi:alkylation response protein AidB-like acyl-CoA dehydrogenase
MGQRATRSGGVRFDAVAVDPADVIALPEPDAPRTISGAFAQQLLSAIAVGIARDALQDAAAFVRDRTRRWVDAEQERAADEPHLLHAFGELTVRVEAAEALLATAAGALDEAQASGAEPAVVRASLAVAAAKAYGGEVAVQVASDLFALTGTAAADDRRNLHRHWRNARTITLHDPARWKYHHIGNHTVNGTPPPQASLI